MRVRQYTVHRPRCTSVSMRDGMLYAVHIRVSECNCDQYTVHGVHRCKLQCAVHGKRQYTLVRATVRSSQSTVYVSARDSTQYTVCSAPLQYAIRGKRQHALERATVRRSQYTQYTTQCAWYARFTQRAVHVSV